MPTSRFLASSMLCSLRTFMEALCSAAVVALVLQTSTSHLLCASMQVRDQIMTEYDRRGIKINTGCSPKGIKKNDDGTLEMTYSSPDGETTGTFDQILMATGRSPNTANLGLENAGVETNKQGCGASRLPPRLLPSLLLVRMDPPEPTCHADRVQTHGQGYAWPHDVC